MTFTTNLNQLESNLKEHIKGEYEFQNTRNGTRIIKEMADSSAMKSNLEKKNPLFYLLLKFRKAYKGSNPSPPDRHASGIYFQWPRGLRLQCHQLEANDGHVDNTQQTNSRGSPPSCYLNRKHKISRSIQTE
jgi:hypothetical protein